MGRCISLLMVCVLLCACQPEHATWELQCTQSHWIYYPVPSYDSKGNVTITMQQQLDCDEQKWVCVKGRDGSTKCPERRQ